MPGKVSTKFTCHNEDSWLMLDDVFNRVSVYSRILSEIFKNFAAFCFFHLIKGSVRCSTKVSLTSSNRVLWNAVKSHGILELT